MTVNSFGVKALYESALMASEACEEIISYLCLLEIKAHDNPEALGWYAEKLDDVIEDIRLRVEDTRAPAEEVCRSLLKLADLYQEILDGNPFV